MATINQLSSVSALQGGDNIAIWDASNGDSRKCSITTLTDYLADALPQPTVLVTQYASPAIDFDVTVSATNSWLLLTPAGASTAATIRFPTAPQDGDVIRVTCSQAVSTLVINVGVGHTIHGAPSSLTANGFFTVQYDAVTTAWWRIG